jgi:hypothetical protein
MKSGTEYVRGLFALQSVEDNRASSSYREVIVRGRPVNWFQGVISTAH